MVYRTFSPYVRLVNWLIQNGGCADRIYFKKNIAGDRSVHICGKTDKGKRLVYVPLRCIMTKEAALKSEIGKKITASGAGIQSGHTVLAAFLLEEKLKPDSFWKAYIDCLPERLDTVPYNYSEAELHHLKGSYALKMLNARRKSLSDEYDALCTAVPGFQKFSMEEFVWGRLIVMTRVFGFYVNGKKTTGLVPVVDVSNHGTSALVRWYYSDTRGGFEITALQNIKQDRELVIAYGRKCNSRFLVNYGFVRKDNDDDNLASVYVPVEDGGYEKNGFLINAPLEFRLSYAYDNTFRRLLALLRSRVAHKGQPWQFPVKNYDGFPASATTERAVLIRLILVCHKALQEFETSLEQDEILLNQGTLSQNMRNIIIMRRGEKRILHKIISLANEFHDLLLQPLQKTLDALGNKFLERHPWREYVEAVILPLLLPADIRPKPPKVQPSYQKIHSKGFK